MRFEFSWVVVMMVGIGCGSSTPATDTGGTEGASTTVMTTSSDGEDSSTPITTAESSSSSDGTSTTGTSTGETTGSTGPGDTTSTGADGSSSESGSDSGSEGSTTGIVEAPCTAGCMVEFECGAEWKSAEACTTWCEGNLIEAAMFSEFCEMAWANLSACFGTLSCDEYAEYVSPTMFPYPCSNEADALMFECEGQ